MGKRYFTQKIVEEELKKKNLKLLSPYLGYAKPLEVECYCGNKFKTSFDCIRRGTTKSCGCYVKVVAKKRRLNLTNQKFNQLLCLKPVGTNKFGAYYWECLCDCGKTCKKLGTQIKSGLRKSCGCCNRPKPILGGMDLTGHKYGKLLCINRAGKSKDGKHCWECLCECGRKSIVVGTKLRTGHTKSCGQCSMRVNGVSTSHPVFQLNKLIPLAEHNYNIVCDGKKINVDLCLTEDKIIIEYDEIYWHKHCIEEDKEKTKIFILNGWKVLRIRTKNKLPSKEQFLTSLNELKTLNISYKEINLNAPKLFHNDPC